MTKEIYYICMYIPHKQFNLLYFLPVDLDSSFGTYSSPRLMIDKTVIISVHIMTLLIQVYNI